jgi:hypothetical protein
MMLSLRTAGLSINGGLHASAAPSSRPSLTMLHRYDAVMPFSST